MSLGLSCRFWEEGGCRASILCIRVKVSTFACPYQVRRRGGYFFLSFL